jgi:hypothetical protein
MRAAVSWGLGGIKEPGGVPWVGGRARRRAAPSGVKVARGTARRMEEANGASTRAASRRQPLKAARTTARRMEGTDGVKRRAAPSLLEATRATARAWWRQAMPHEGCIKAAQTGGLQNCKGHGGGKRCQQEGCLTVARAGTQHCAAHGGGRRCQQAGCPKSAQGSTLHCKAHGGGRRCQHEGCFKSVAKAPGSVFCTLCLRGTQPPPDGAEAQ